MLVVEGSIWRAVAVYDATSDGVFRLVLLGCYIGRQIELSRTRERLPRDAVVKAKIGAALECLSVKAYIVQLVEAHWAELEKKGQLPKGK
ncbi:MAG: hypothetical protein P0120_15275 [Nitrospira sp.]|nr:hypothetical protein [Nitrospira sp.]